MTLRRSYTKMQRRLLDDVANALARSFLRPQNLTLFQVKTRNRPLVVLTENYPGFICHHSSTCNELQNLGFATTRQDSKKTLLSTILLVENHQVVIKFKYFCGIVSKKLLLKNSTKPYHTSETFTVIDTALSGL